MLYIIIFNEYQASVCLTTRHNAKCKVLLPDFNIWKSVEIEKSIR